MDANAWKRVWAAIDSRRVELGWSKSRLYNETGTSETTFREMKLRGLEIKSPERLSAICHALGWSTDSIDAILDGGGPAPAPPHSDDSVMQRLDRIEELVQLLVQGQNDLVEGQQAGLDGLRKLATQLAQRAPRRAAQ